VIERRHALGLTADPHPSTFVASVSTHRVNSRAPVLHHVGMAGRQGDLGLTCPEQAPFEH